MERKLEKESVGKGLPEWWIESRILWEKEMNQGAAKQGFHTVKKKDK